MQASSKTSVIEVNLKAIAENYLKIRSSVKPAYVWAVVKGDAYGLGLERVATVLKEAGADRFVVHNAVEAEHLRKIVHHSKILCLTAFETKDVDLLLVRNILISVGSNEQLSLVTARARINNRKALLHLEIDTGVGRGGFLPSQVRHANLCIEKEKHLHLCGVWSHLADAGNHKIAYQQLKYFQKATENIPSFVERHFSNSGGILLGRKFFLDAVRPGLALYGLHPDIDGKLCFSWTSRIVSIVSRPRGYRIGYGRGTYLRRNSILGVVPLGFVDGYPRIKRGVAGVRNSIVKIIGPVAMNTMVLDLTDLMSASPGDKVVFVGNGGPSLRVLLKKTSPSVIPNLFSCIRTKSVKIIYN